MKRSVLKSIWAVFAGFLMIVAFSIAADTLLKIAGILPWDHLFVSTGQIGILRIAFGKEPMSYR